MKRMLPLLLALTLLLSGCGFSLPSAPAQPTAAPTPVPEVTQAPTPEPTPEPSPAPTPEPVVIYDALYEAGSYQDEFSNSWDYVLRIPAIQSSGADATRLNQELFTALYPSVKNAQDSMAGNYSLMISRVDYQIFINEQLISIVAEVDTDWGFEEYYVVNFDAATRTECTRAQLLQRFGMSEDDFVLHAQETVEQYFVKHYSNVVSDSMYPDRHDKSVAAENFKSDCQLFVNDQGELSMIFKLYSFAGADYYYKILPVI